MEMSRRPEFWIMRDSGYVRQLGKYYLNSDFELRDACALISLPCDEEPEYISLRRPFIEANRKPVTPTDDEESQFNIPHFHNNPHYGIIKHGGHKSIIDHEGRQGRSVESWWPEHDEIVFGSNISKDVEEWVEWLGFKALSICISQDMLGARHRSSI